MQMIKELLSCFAIITIGSFFGMSGTVVLLTLIL